MAITNIYPFGQNEEVPAGYPIADDLDTNDAQQALSAKQGVRIKGLIDGLSSSIPEQLIFGEPCGIIYTIDDFILVHEYDENNNIDNLKFSNDLGKTWVTKANSFGKIVNVFMFADGTLMIAGKKSDGCRIYWTRDFSTFTEANIIDYNGQPYTRESGKTRFYILKPKSFHTFVNGVEHYCFWDYIITTTNPRLWYAISDGDGVTVRAAFAFGLSAINGSTLPARHGHAFDYNPYDGYFYGLTGDAANECHVMKGKYTDNNGVHTWEWERLATGAGYKLTSISYDEGNLYAVTDYTDAALADAKGIVSVPIDKLGLSIESPSGIVRPKIMRYLFRATKAFMKEGSLYPNPNDSQIAAMSGFTKDNHGWRVCGTDYMGGSKTLIAKGGHNFVWVDNNINKKFGAWIGPNNQGDLIVSEVTPGSSTSGEDYLKLSHKITYNFTKVMRDSGASDFFADLNGTLY